MYNHTIIITYAIKSRKLRSKFQYYTILAACFEVGHDSRLGKQLAKASRETEFPN